MHTPMLASRLRHLHPSRRTTLALGASSHRQPPRPAACAQPRRLQHAGIASSVQQLNDEMEAIFGPAHPSAPRLTAAAHPAEGEEVGAHTTHHFHPTAEAPRLTAASQPHPLPAADAAAAPAPLSIHVHLPASLVAAGAAAGGLHIHVHFGEGAPAKG